MFLFEFILVRICRLFCCTPPCVCVPEMCAQRHILKPILEQSLKQPNSKEVRHTHTQRHIRTHTPPKLTITMQRLETDKRQRKSTPVECSKMNPQRALEL